MIHDITGPDDESVPLLYPKALRILLKIVPKKWRLRSGGEKHKDRPLDRLYRFLGNRPFWGYNILFLLVTFLLGVNGVLAKNNIEQEILQSGALYNIEEKASFTASMGQYTPVIQEDPTAMVLSTAMQNTSGYFSQPLITETKVTEQPPEPEQEAPQEDLRNRSHTITYTVQNGDTLSKIGWQYGLKVATIQYQNKIKGETITPGQKLTLPPGDISSTLIAKANQKSQYVADNRVASLPSGSQGGYVKPINWSYISRRVGGGHNGTDMCAPVGTAVAAAKGGVVERAEYGWNGGYGLYVLINHGGGVKTRYAHLSSIAVHAGQSVGAGQYIGASGSSGRSTGPHLHFEAIENGRYTAPF